MYCTMEATEYPYEFADLIAFLCEKYHVDRNGLFVEYSSRPPPPLKGTRAGYYEGLLSYRQRNGHIEFLITVFKASPDPRSRVRSPSHEPEDRKFRQTPTPPRRRDRKIARQTSNGRSRRVQKTD